jgi:phospholipase C
VVCGDLSSVFRPYNGEKIALPAPVEKDAFIESVHKARFRELPHGYKQLTPADIAQVLQNPAGSPLLPRQEKGIRQACALPYELYADGQLDADKKSFEINFAAQRQVFGKKAAGAPFLVYAPGKYKTEDMRVWSYGVAAGDHLQDSWPLEDFENSAYHLQVHGPNGFFREFKGGSQDPLLQVSCRYQQAAGNPSQLTGHLALQLHNNSKQTYTVSIKDNAYKSGARTQVVAPGQTGAVVLDLGKSHGWYDCSVQVKGYAAFEKRYAGRVETGKHSFTDPLMGKI